MTELPSLRLSSEEAYFLSLCDGSTRLRDILRLGRSRSEAAQTLYTLLACGLVEFVPSPGGAPSSTEVPFLRDAEDAAGADEWPDPDARDARARAAFADALASLRQGDGCRAVALLQECVHLSPYDSEYRVRLGDVLSRQPLWRRRALAQYREALGLDPSREDALMRVAELLLEEEKTEAAREIARGLIARHPDTPEYRDLLGRCTAAGAPRGGDDPPPMPNRPGTPGRRPTR
jgi:tetratricopeptide (TPR) repeat protein